MITYKQLLVLLEDYKSDWLEKQRKQGSVTPENEQEHKDWLEHFHKNKKSLKPEHQELHKHRNLQSIKDAFEESSNKRSSDSLQKRHDTATPEERKGAETIHNANGLQVQHIKTEEASKHYGSGTKCCTSAREDNMFNPYTKDVKGGGKLYIVHGKDEKGNPHRYTIVPHANEWRDELDTQLGAHEIVKRNPELKNVKELQGTHPALTSDENLHKHLPKLMKSHPVETLSDERVRNNPKLIKDSLDHISDDVKGNVAYNQSTHPDTLHHLATHPDSSDDVKGNVADNPSTHPDTLHHLATHKDASEDVKRSVAYNQSTHPDTLHHLATHPDSSDYVKGNVAYNQSTHPDTLHHLATHPDSSELVKRRVAYNKSTHPDTQEYLKTGKDKYKSTKYSEGNGSNYKSTKYSEGNDAEYKPTKYK